MKIATVPAAGCAERQWRDRQLELSLSRQQTFWPASWCSRRPANQVAAAYASFTFQVQDDGGTCAGGSNTHPTHRTMTIKIAAVNAAPVGTSGTVSSFQSAVYTFKTSDFGFSDPNNNPPNSLWFQIRHASECGDADT